VVNDVQEAIEFYTRHLGFELRFSAVPAFADVVRADFGCCSQAQRALPVERWPTDASRVQAAATESSSSLLTSRGEVKRFRDAGVSLRNEIVTGPGGRQILLDDPTGNPTEVFQPADPQDRQ
jgi:catechol 2,3-dioxygenase-like lactoylglutathione lyase family enzyme